MTPRVSPQMQRLAALAILAALVMAVVVGVIEPVVSAYVDAGQTIARDRAAVAHAEQSGLDTTTLQAELASLKAQAGPPPGSLQSANESLAAAELQRRLKTVIEAVHGEVRSMQTLPPRLDSGFRRITVRGQASLKIAGLQQAVYDLETTSPLLFLDNVEVTAHPDQSGHPGAAEDPRLDVRFDLYGYMKATP
jgi:general secretion pathway protein M